MLTNVSPFSILLTLVIVVLLFGTGKLRNVGSDLGKAIRNFKKALHEKDESTAAHDVEKPELLESSADDKSQPKKSVDQ